MKNCPHCNANLPRPDRFCPSCGRPLVLPAENATVALGKTFRLGESGPMAALKPLLPSAVPLTTLFRNKERLVLGRAPDCDVQLPHPMVSRYHAFLERLPDGSLRLRDLASVNGVWVNGVRLTEPVLVGPEQRVGIGPFLFTLADGVITIVDCSRSVRLEARKLEKVVRVGKGKTKKLLDNINLVVNPGEFVCLLGPSGSGKSTLMDALNGRRRATGGTVLANGEDFYEHFHNFRQSLGYVPQKDIVHTDLTVHKALDYTARLRLPKDTDPEELQARVDRVLEEMELTEHRDKQIANLSGGQIKRVSLGAELLGQPCLLYIDEATSGLDPGMELRMMTLFRKLADEGRSVLCITHAVENIDKCHLILILAEGRMMYYGPPKEAPGFFGLKSIGDIYNLFYNAKDKSPVAVWETRFAISDYHKKYVVQRLEEPAQRTDPVRPLGLVPSGLVPLGPETPVPVPSAPVPGGAETPPPAGAGDAAASPEGPQTGEAHGARAERAEEAKEAGTAKAGERRLHWLGESLRLVSLSKLPPLADHIRRVTARYLDFQKLVAPIAEFWHQFGVLLSRYVVLTLADRRSLRLLLLQAPVVGLFLLLGFVGRKYQEPITLLRKMTPEERARLEAVEAVAAASDKEGPPGEQFRDVEFSIPGQDGQYRRMTGGELKQLFDDLRDPVAAMKRQGDEATLRINKDNKEVRTFTSKQLNDAWRALEQQDRFREVWNKPLDDLSPEDRQALQACVVKLHARDGGGQMRDVEVNGLELFQLRQDLREASLMTVRVRVPVEGQPDKKEELTGAQLIEGLKQFHQSRVAGQMLELARQEKTILPSGMGVNPRFTYTVLFILVMIVLWFGCNNAAKEIVKEEAVYARERAVNLGIVPYLASKFLLLSLITVAHSLLLVAVLFGSLHAAHALLPEVFSVPFPEHLVSYTLMLGVLALLSMCGVAMGLLLSASVSSPDRASTLLPYVLIPQMIFGGGFIAVKYGEPLYYVASIVSPAYWAYRAVRRGANDPRFEGYPFYTTTPDGLLWPCVALAVQTVVLLLLAAWFLRRKDLA